MGCTRQPTTEKSIQSTEKTEFQFLKGVSADKQADYATAIMWYQKAARQGDAGAQKALPQAQFELGIMYFVGGKRATQNYQEAFKWFKKAAVQEHAGA